MVTQRRGMSATLVERGSPYSKVIVGVVVIGVVVAAAAAAAAAVVVIVVVCCCIFKILKE